MRLSFGIAIVILITSCTSKKTFRWDMAAQRVLIYDYSQKVYASNKLSRFSSADSAQFKANGKLEIDIKGNKSADVTLKNINTISYQFDDLGHLKDSTEGSLENMVAQGMAPDGSFPKVNRDVVFEMLFRLPENPLGKNEIDSISMSSPFNAGGSILDVNGYSTLTFKGYEMFDGTECAVFDGIINISDVDKPRSLEGDYIFSTVGNGTFYFNHKEGYYQGVDLSIIVSAIIDNEQENQLGMYVNMYNKSDFEIRFNGVNESMDK